MALSEVWRYMRIAEPVCVMWTSATCILCMIRAVGSCIVNMRVELSDAQFDSSEHTYLHNTHIVQKCTIGSPCYVASPTQHSILKKELKCRPTQTHLLIIWYPIFMVVNEKIHVIQKIPILNFVKRKPTMQFFLLFFFCFLFSHKQV